MHTLLLHLWWELGNIIHLVNEILHYLITNPLFTQYVFEWIVHIWGFDFEGIFEVCNSAFHKFELIDETPKCIEVYEEKLVTRKENYALCK